MSPLKKDSDFEFIKERLLSQDGVEGVSLARQASSVTVGEEEEFPTAAQLDMMRHRIREREIEAVGEILY